MATPKSVWGIDIGQVALKALKLQDVDGELQVEAFDIIEHPKILSQPDADRKQLIRQALEQFLARNSVLDSVVAVAVPGQASFTRFVKLPPVEEKRIPDIVRFEAEQQIPFPINDVHWRWHTFRDPDSPDIELGIFAMKKVDVDDTLSHFEEVQMGVDIVQMAPLALYNYMMHDGSLAEDGATLLLDVGADKTDLVVSDGARVWTRTIRIGGNNFTESLVRAFKLSFTKAEMLKRSAASSKYAKQIFQAMRPVFADLVQEIQKSVGAYTSTHRESRFKKLIGLGNGFRLPGLQKFLEQNLNIPVVRIDTFNKIVPSATVNAPTFIENVLSFAVPYGLALQALKLAKIDTNLLPEKVAAERLWAAKRPWFAASAAALLLTLGLYTFSAYRDAGVLEASAAQSGGGGYQKAAETIRKLDGWIRSEQNLASAGSVDKQQIETYFRLLGYHKTWPAILVALDRSLLGEHKDIAFPSDMKDDKCLFPDDAKYLAPMTGADEKAFADLRSQLEKIDRDKRKLVIVDKLSAKYLTDVTAIAAAATPAGAAPVAPAAAATPAVGAVSPTAGKPSAGFEITVTAHSTLNELDTNTRLVALRDQILPKITADISQEVFGKNVPGIRSVEVKYELTQSAAAAPGAGTAATTWRINPLFPTENTSKDTSFTITWKVAVDGDGVVVPEDVNKTAK